jgi:DNA-directed RNA polymerase specialized sigma24 family protein
VVGPRQTFQRSAVYATAADFCRIFAEGMRNLYWLSFILTADPGKAEQCFVAGLDDCFAGNGVFKEWARSWARRTIIKNAIRLISPEFTSASGASNDTVLDRDETAAGNHLPLAEETEISAILHLDPFDRFAFVMSVLEGLSDRDSALLLGCTRQVLVAGRVRALQRLSHAIATTERRRDDIEAIFVKSA